MTIVLKASGWHTEMHDPCRKKGKKKKGNMKLRTKE
jgi:hypothetical protein